MKQSAPEHRNSTFVTISSVVILLFSLAFDANGGTVVTQSISAPFSNYGTGLYVAPQGGFNIFQDSLEGEGSSVPAHTDLGGFAGAKVGYVSGTGLIRPTIETDLFFNRFTGNFGDSFPDGFKWNDKYTTDSGAFMENGISRFNLGAFQPYVGAGLGIYTAEVKVAETFSDPFLSIPQRYNFKEDATSWAWQVIAGSDYYFTRTVSVFAEYKFLNYMNMASASGDCRIGQHLLGIGVRIHF